MTVRNIWKQQHKVLRDWGRKEGLALGWWLPCRVADRLGNKGLVNGCVGQVLRLSWGGSCREGLARTATAHLAGCHTSSPSQLDWRASCSSWSPLSLSTGQHPPRWRKPLTGADPAGPVCRQTCTWEKKRLGQVVLSITCSFITPGSHQPQSHKPLGSHRYNGSLCTHVTQQLNTRCWVAGGSHIAEMGVGGTE